MKHKINIRKIVQEEIQNVMNEGTYNDKNHIASFDDKAGSSAEVYFINGKYYVQVSGDVDYDMEAKNKKELIDKLKRDGFKYPPYVGTIK